MFKRFLKRFGKFVRIKIFSNLSPSFLEEFIYFIAVSRVNTLPADESLRFLFRLGNRFYLIEGQQAIRYGGGLHTKHRHIKYHEFFVKRIHHGERVLDIGCGNGALSFDVAEKAGAKVTSIDMSAESIAMAGERYSHPRISYEVRDALVNLPEGTYDVVILSNVLEHLPKRSEFLRKVTTVSSPGRFLIRVPLFERDWRVPLKRELGVEWRLDSTHETEYILESFDQEMADAGLQITYQEVRWGEILAEATPRET